MEIMTAAVVAVVAVVDVALMALVMVAIYLATTLGYAIISEAVYIVKKKISRRRKREKQGGVP